MRPARPTTESNRAIRWTVIRAARAFYGRPLQLEDLEKIHAAQAHPMAVAGWDLSRRDVGQA